MLCYVEQPPASSGNLGNPSLSSIGSSLRLGFDVKSEANSCPGQSQKVTSEKTCPREWPLWFEHLEAS